MVEGLVDFRSAILQFYAPMIEVQRVAVWFREDQVWQGIASYLV